MQGKHKVLAIGLDALDPDVFESLIQQGYLKNLANFRAQAAFGKLTNIPHYRAETPWTTFLTGCYPEKLGYWGPITYDPLTYEAYEIGAYDFQQFQPFYALGEAYRIAIFDMSQARLSEQVNGLQILGWGSHSQQCRSGSSPPDLLQEIMNRYGPHPAYDEESLGTNDHANPYDSNDQDHLKEQLLTGIQRRSQICRDLWQREPWDLFLTLFGEVHAAEHSFWQTLYPHPLSEFAETGALLDILQAVDRAVGEIVEEVDAQTTVVIFAAHGMGANVQDIPSMALLPEFMYRWNFSGKAALTPNHNSVALPPLKSYPSQHWKYAVWEGVTETAPMDLASPWAQMEAGDSLNWQPSNWYKPLWPRMQAFALPSFSEGCIRINLEGREAQGCVKPEEYEALCDHLCQGLEQLRDGRTGTPMVESIDRTRSGENLFDPTAPPADLIIHWQEAYPTDVMVSPDLGCIGPIPYFRTGGHRSRGFLMIQGPGISASTLPTGEAIDLPVTLLNLMGAEPPVYMRGRSLLESHP